MSVLLIDVGNTRAKWQLRNSDQFLSGVIEHRSLGSDWVEDLQSQITNEAIEKVCVATVASIPDVQQKFKAIWADKLIWLEHPFTDQDYFYHCYANPERLGVDRWLCMIGASQIMDGNLIVVDAGTALKVDVFSNKNGHLGGYIVPGLQMAQQALWQNTDKVIRFGDEEGLNATESAIALGRSTFECVSSGIRRQALSLIDSVRNEYPDFALMVCGGDGEWLANSLGCCYRPELIFEGMNRVCAGSL